VLCVVLQERLQLLLAYAFDAWGLLRHCVLLLRPAYLQSAQALLPGGWSSWDEALHRQFLAVLVVVQGCPAASKRTSTQRTSSYVSHTAEAEHLATMQALSDSYSPEANLSSACSCCTMTTAGPSRAEMKCMCNSPSWVLFRHRASICPFTITACLCVCV
jgi:hypothetical protein